MDTDLLNEASNHIKKYKCLLEIDIDFKPKVSNLFGMISKSNGWLSTHVSEIDVVRLI